MHEVHDEEAESQSEAMPQCSHMLSARRQVLPRRAEHATGSLLESWDTRRHLHSLKLSTSQVQVGSSSIVESGCLQ